MFFPGLGLKGREKIDDEICILRHQNSFKLVNWIS